MAHWPHLKVDNPASVVERKPVVYRAFDADDHLLYVGSSTNVMIRLATHQTMKAWWSDVDRVEITTFASAEAMDRAERCAIRDEAPAYNITGNPARAPEPVVEKPVGDHLSRADLITALDEAGQARVTLAASLAAEETRLRGLILAALAAGIPQALVAEKAGYHRNSIAAMWKRNADGPSR